MIDLTCVEFGPERLENELFSSRTNHSQAVTRLKERWKAEQQKLDSIEIQIGRYIIEQIS